MLNLALPSTIVESNDYSFHLLIDSSLVVSTVIGKIFVI